MTLLIDGERHDLAAGDSVTFDADLHHFENHGDAAAEFLAVVAAGLGDDVRRSSEAEPRRC